MVDWEYLTGVEKATFIFNNILTAREKHVLSERFGLNHQKPKTFDLIGKDLDRSREAIRQIQVKAVEKLQRALSRAPEYWENYHG